MSMPVRLSRAENSASVERFSPTTSTDLPRPMRAEAIFTAVRRLGAGAAVTVKEKPLTAVSIISWAFASRRAGASLLGGVALVQGSPQAGNSSRGFTPGTFSAPTSRTKVMAVRSPRLSFQSQSAKVEMKYFDSMVMPDTAGRGAHALDDHLIHDGVRQLGHVHGAQVDAVLCLI